MSGRRQELRACLNRMCASRHAPVAKAATETRGVAWTLSLVAILPTAAGCGGDAGVEFAAADALRAAAAGMQTAVAEYHAEVVAADDRREAELVEALIARIRASRDDEAALAAHAASFGEAMRKLRQDRQVEDARRAAAVEHAEVVEEVAAGLERIAVESLSLRDEVRRYVRAWSQLRRQAQARENRAAEGNR